MRKSILPILLSFAVVSAAFSQIKSLDAKFIASNYYKGIVKILLYDSIAGKLDSSSAYIGRGSGFIVSEDGVIFTNRHVIEMCLNGYISYDYYNEQSNSTSRYIEMYSDEVVKDSNLVKIHRIGYPAPIIQVYSGKGENDYKLYYARILSVSVGSFDGAVLQIVSDAEGKPAGNIFQPVPIGNSDSTYQGEDLCVYGYPQQYEGGFSLMLKDMSTLTFGKHSGFDFVYNKDFGYIKTDASINSGNSGGPVFNADEKVIGIATAAFNKTNIGLAGGINAMYYIVSPEIDILQKLSAKGLKMPGAPGAIRTTKGERRLSLTQKQIEDINKKKSDEMEVRKAKMEQEKRNEAMSTYANSLMLARPKTKTFIYGGVGVGSYQRGTIDLFWQSINNDPSLEAKGEGSPFVWNAGFQFFFSGQKESKGYGGFGIEFFSTSKRAIGAYHQRDNVINEIRIGLKEIIFSIPIAYRVKDKMMLVAEPGFIYMGFVRGTITALGNTYKEKNLFDFGWNLTAGMNYSLKKYFGVLARAGYRHLVSEEAHRDARDGTENTYSFFANGVDGENTIIKWNGFYCTTGIYFAFDRAGSAKRKTAPAK